MFLNSDFDKQILGIILDKFFGIIYGIIFSYICITASIILLNKFEYNTLNDWLMTNSKIIYNIKNFNKNFINHKMLEDEINIIDQIYGFLEEEKINLVF